MAEEYNAEEIQVLKGLEAVRVRPGMYIGSTSQTGLHQCVYEIIDNSIDEFMAGYGDVVAVSLNKDTSCTVSDHGRGIPVDKHKQTGKSALELVLTELHAGGKFGGGGYKVSGGLHGVGASCVNALSNKLIAIVHRDGKVYQMEFSRGKVTKELSVIGTCKKGETGTEITFYPDGTIFETLDYDYPTLRRRLRELAFLNKGIRIVFTDYRDVDEEGKPKQEEFHYEGGITSYVEYLSLKQKSSVNKEPIYLRAEYTDRIVTTKAEDGTERTHKATDIVEVAFQYCTSDSSRIYTYTNNINTKFGGTHLSGFKDGLVTVLNKYGHDLKVFKAKDNIQQKDIEDGLIAIISIKFEEPQFEGQTKEKLGSSAARTQVKNAVTEFVSRYFDQHQDEAKAIIDAVYLNAKAREAAKKAKELTKKKQSASNITLSDKLAKCSSKDAEECEIYLVEGDSAGGSAKQGRDRRTQAILPLRGKILNVEKASEKSIMSNQEIRTMIATFGCGTHEDYNEDKLNFHKVIIMTDADVDGAHIRTLLLTFFFRYMRPLIENGHVYIAQPPLFLVKKGKKHWYTYNDDEQRKLLKEVGSDGVSVQRYKGLGEMNPSQLYETTMNPTTRTIIQCSIEDAQEADETFSLLMGDDVPPRRKYIKDNAHKVMNLDF